MLYNRRIRTTLPGPIRNNNPDADRIREHLDEKSKKSKDHWDNSAQPLAPLYAGQKISFYDTIRKIWIPATILTVLPNDKYRIETTEGTVYNRTRRQLRERSVRPDDTHTAPAAQQPVPKKAFVYKPFTPAAVPAPVANAQAPKPVAPATPVVNTPVQANPATGTTPATPMSAPRPAQDAGSSQQPRRSSHVAKPRARLIEQM